MLVRIAYCVLAARLRNTQYAIRHTITIGQIIFENAVIITMPP
jgi:hypothetical protein